ncbi:aldo/keto reductase [Falsirhodobacter algicola]|uniref:Aldo/keto reductase n=1 Tax=Falsirhodobacter algicola TaxID=2692330 RepID=A0A8J8SK42_9RHOB|nr:aldo/keto reductase [Falsirhodobacter algicola]QUS34962.1 aldo/keto reductase [Falsirhodobacter algicola]
MKRRLGQTDIQIAPWVLGTNTAGWTADEATSFATFDAFVDAGFTALDTADVYSRWVPGNDSESEKIIGRWMKARGNRDKVHVFTKTGMDMGDGRKGLSARRIEEAVEDSLTRLQTDYIDLYQSHQPDPDTPEEETLEAYERLVQAGKVRWIGCSNYNTAELERAIRTSKEKGIAQYQSVQNEFNLYARDKYDADLAELMQGNGLSLLPFFSLAGGFLTGKYRSEDDLRKSKRGESIGRRYMNPKGHAILHAMDRAAEREDASLTEIALAWIVAQPGVVGALASASSPQQVAELAGAVTLELSADSLRELTAAGI